MLLFIIIFLLIFLLQKSNYRFNVFLLTLFVSIFFFSASDPIIGIPYFFWLSFFSILLSLPKRQTINTSAIFMTMALVLVLLIQTINIALGFNVQPALLINQSTTDTNDIAAQMFFPTLNLTVIKHFTFLLEYLVFLLFNSDILSKETYISKSLVFLIKSFRCFFICMIVEFLIVNITGFNDRPLLEFIFNLKANAHENWNLFGPFSSVFWCFAERSGVGITYIYFLIRIAGNNIRISLKEITWDVLGVVTCFISGSTTAIFAACFYVIYFVFIVLFHSKARGEIKLFTLFVFAIGIIIFIPLLEVMLNKTNQFLNPTVDYGSAYFRSRSILLAWNNIIKSPIVGLGIGTVYCHSALIQTIANIGFLGLFLLLGIHYSMLKSSIRKFDFNLFVSIVFLIAMNLNGFMLQQMTSPILLVLFLALTKPAANLSFTFARKKAFSCSH